MAYRSGVPESGPMKAGKQTEWPRWRPEPLPFKLTPDGFEKSGRSVAGPLRLGTAPGVGPRGPAGGYSSDMGMDRVSPRGFDPMGTSDTRAPAQEASRLISERSRR
jgi:hypothetical protein